MSLSQTAINQIISKRKQRWLDLYDPAKPGTRLYLIRYMPELPERPWPHLDNTAERVEWAWRKYQLQLEQLEWLDDDTLPFLDLYTGTEIFASAFGCKTYYPANDMPYVMPLVRSADLAALENIAIPDFSIPPIAQVFDMAEQLRRRAGPDALMHLVDVQSPMDIAALIWDKTIFYPAMLEYPQAVKSLAEKVLTFQMRFFDEWFRRFGREFIAHFPDCYMPYGITLSEEEVGMVSGKMFNTFFLPDLVSLSERYKAIGVRCSANARHQWNNFKKIPNFKWFSLAQPPEVTQEAWSFFADQAAQWHSYQGEGRALTWHEQHPTQARMVYEVFVDSKAEAIETAKRMRALFSS